MFYSIRTQVISIIVLLVVPFVIMGYLFWQQAAGALRESIETSTVQTLNQYAGFVEGTIGQAMNAANQILRNETTQSWIRARSEPDAVQQLLQNMKMRKYFDAVVSSSPVIFSVNLYYGAWDLWNLDGDEYLHSEWYEAYRNEGTRWQTAHYDRRQNGTVQNNTRVFGLVYPLSDLMNLREVGILKINLRTQTLLEPLEKITLGATGKSYLITGNGESVLGQQLANMPGPLLERVRFYDEGDDGAGIYRDDASKTIYFYRPLTGLDWAIVGSVSETELFERINAARQNVLIVAVLLLAATVALAFWFSSGIAAPITRIVKSMRFVEAGDFLKGHAVLNSLKTKQSEIGYLTSNYQNMVHRLQSYIETEYAQNLRRRNAEYKALLLQINPHFLSNTLEVISSLALQGRNQDMDRVVHELNLMLRSTLRVDNEQIRLADEIRLIRAFTSILSVCYGNRVQFNIVDDHIRDDLLIPKLLLQPLIENAVKYSLGIVEIARISISISERADELRFVIGDNGVGIPDDVLKELTRDAELNFAQDVLQIGEKGVGLKNVMARGRLYYGSRFFFDIRTSAGQGTEITMVIPVKE